MSEGTEATKNILTDRFYIVGGGCSFVRDAAVRMVDAAPTVVHLVPTGNPDLSANPARWPYEFEVIVHHELRAGTVDEHVERYREQLTKIYNVIAGEPGADIPPLGTPDFGPMQRALDADHVKPGVSIPKADNADVQARDDQRARLTTVKPRHDAKLRSVLRRLCSQYALATGAKDPLLGLDYDKTAKKLAEDLTTYAHDNERQMAMRSVKWVDVADDQLDNVTYTTWPAKVLDCEEGCAYFVYSFDEHGIVKARRDGNGRRFFVEFGHVDNVPKVVAHLLATARFDRQGDLFTITVFRRSNGQVGLACECRQLVDSPQVQG